MESGLSSKMKQFEQRYGVLCYRNLIHEKYYSKIFFQDNKNKYLLDRYGNKRYSEDSENVQKIEKFNFNIKMTRNFKNK